MPSDARDNPPGQLPAYTFLPWARRGVAAAIDQVDLLGADPTPGEALRGRATVTACLTLETQPVDGAPAIGPTSITQTVHMVGPGDVKALQPATVLRSVPVPGTQAATAGELAFVEFYDEDLPWRYTPARAHDHRLRPWLALLVLEVGEFDLLRRPGLPAVLHVHQGVELPPATETWAWAHVQVAGNLPAHEGLNDLVEKSPDLVLSRLLSPRRLRPLKSYHAFVVPAFEAGRIAGLESHYPGSPAQRTYPQVPVQQPSWTTPTPPEIPDFPVLHDWSFATGEESNFQTLAQRPRPIDAARFGKRPLDMSCPGANLPTRATMHLEGALQPVGFGKFRAKFPFEDDLNVNMQTALGSNVDLDQGSVEDPIVTLPAYARGPAGVTRLSEATAVGPRLGWLVELNTDPRNRAAAGLGAQIVRHRDEDLMARAWAQVEEIAAVNQRLREADLALAANDRIFAKHVAALDADRLLQLSAAAQTGTTLDGTSTTVRGAVDASRVPAAAQSPTFRRIARPERRLVRAVRAGGLRSGLLTRLNAETGSVDAVSAAPPAPPLAAATRPSDVQRALEVAVEQQRAHEQTPRQVFVRLAHQEVQGRGGNAVKPVLNATEVEALRASLIARLGTAVPPPVQGLAATDDAAVLRADVMQIIGKVQRLEPLPSGHVVMTIGADTFEQYYGSANDSRAYRGVTFAPPRSTLETTARTADAADIDQFMTDFATFTTASDKRADATERKPLAELDAVGIVMAQSLSPSQALPARLQFVLRGADSSIDALDTTRRLRPVLDHPHFLDPLFGPLREMSQDFIIPNIADLAPESIAVLEPNARFVESVMAGANTEMARELLWREFPTDQRGTYFDRFWDARDAVEDAPDADIAQLAAWDGQLGLQSGSSASLLVLVVRAELLVKFPSTVIFAQSGRYENGKRTLDDGGDIKYPVLRGHLDPDIELFGFALTAADAVGRTDDAGYFFCFMERPGQLRFGLDPGPPPPALTTWDELAWSHLDSDPEYVTFGGANANLGGLDLPGWGVTAAKQAFILCQSPVLLARHASDMLPGAKDSVTTALGNRPGQFSAAPGHRRGTGR